MDRFSTEFRILDANSNRAAEGLRTLEEIIRFGFNHPQYTHRLKEIRHELQGLVGQFDQRQLLEARDTRGDVGTHLTTRQEQTRSDLRAIASSAVGRVQQSLRCLEEFSKMIAPELAVGFERLRYRSYDLFAELLLLLEGNRFPQEARLYLLCDCQLDLEHFFSRIRDVCQAGVDIVQIRDKSADDRRLLLYARKAKEAMQGTRGHLVLNDRIDLAMLSEADGLHLGQEDLPIAEARRLLGSKMWIGVSTHNIEQAYQAQASGADYIGCGPTFPSTTKQFDSFSKIDFLKEVASQISIPAFAIGGIDSQNVRQVVDAGISRIAVQGAIWNQAVPAREAKCLAEILSPPIPTTGLRKND